jgi:large subunit ribosomal protein L22
MIVSATAKYIGTSSRKIGLVAQAVRGKRATEAVAILAAIEKRAAGPLDKVLKSAIANAENNHGIKRSDLTVEQVLVGPSKTLKRYRPRARGSAYPVRKRSSHITVSVSNNKLEAESASHAKAQLTTTKKASPAATKKKAEKK